MACGEGVVSVNTRILNSRKLASVFLQTKLASNFSFVRIFKDGQRLIKGHMYKSSMLPTAAQN